MGNTGAHFTACVDPPYGAATGELMNGLEPVGIDFRIGVNLARICECSCVTSCRAKYLWTSTAGTDAHDFVHAWDRDSY